MKIIGDKQKFAIEIKGKEGKELYSYILWINNGRIGHIEDTSEISYLQSFLSSLLKLRSSENLCDKNPAEILNFIYDYKFLTHNHIDVYEAFLSEKINVDELIERNLAYSFDDFFTVHYRIKNEIVIASKLRDNVSSSFDYTEYSTEIYSIRIPVNQIETLIDTINKFSDQ